MCSCERNHVNSQTTRLVTFFVVNEWALEVTWNNRRTDEQIKCIFYFDWEQFLNLIYYLSFMFNSFTRIDLNEYKCISLVHFIETLKHWMPVNSLKYYGRPFILNINSDGTLNLHSSYDNWVIFMSKHISAYIFCTFSQPIKYIT